MEEFSLARKLVDQAGYGTNRSYLLDFIPIQFNVKLLDFDEIKRLFNEKHQSVVQIAAQFDVSRSVISGVLSRSGITIGTSAGCTTHPENYTHNSPPYGYKVVNRKLVANKAELKICRLIVELRAREKLSTRKIAAELKTRGFKNRKGRTTWNTPTILNIYKRWNGKI